MLKFTAQNSDGGHMAGTIIVALLLALLGWNLLKGLQNSPAEKARKKKIEDRMYRVLLNEPEPVLREWERKRPELRGVVHRIREVKRWSDSS